MTPEQIRKYPMFTLGATRDRALKQRTLDWAVKSGEVKLQDTFYPIGSVGGSKEGTEMTWKYFKEVRYEIHTYCVLYFNLYYAREFLNLLLLHTINYYFPTTDTKYTAYYSTTVLIYTNHILTTNKPPLHSYLPPELRAHQDHVRQSLSLSDGRHGGLLHGALLHYCARYRGRGLLPDSSCAHCAAPYCSELGEYAR